MSIYTLIEIYQVSIYILRYVDNTNLMLNSIIGYNDVYIYHGCNIACHFLATDCIYIEVLSEFKLHVGTRSFYSY